MHFIAQYRRSTLLKFWHNGPFFMLWQPEFWSKFNSFSYFGKGSPGQHSCEVWMELAYWFRRSSHLKEIVDAARRRMDDGRRTTDNGHWPITIAHHEHLVLRWANNSRKKKINDYSIQTEVSIAQGSRPPGIGSSCTQNTHDKTNVCLWNADIWISPTINIGWVVSTEISWKNPQWKKKKKKKETNKTSSNHHHGYSFDSICLVITKSILLFFFTI